MKILYRILTLLLWIIVLVNMVIGLPICLAISPVIYLVTGKGKGLYFDMYIKIFEKLIDIVKNLEKKGE